MTTSRLIGYKALADLVGKLSLFLIVVQSARVLPVSTFGLLWLAVTLGWILSVASDFGAQLHVARAVARRPHQAGAIVRPWFRLRLVSTVAALGVAMPITIGLAPRAEAPAFFAVVLAQLVSALVEFVNHYYRGLSRTEIESSLTIAHRLTSLAATLVVLALAPSLGALAVALLVPAAATLGVSLALAARVGARGHARADVSPIRPDRSLAGEFRREVAPIGLGILLSALYFRVDVFLVQAWVGMEAVGRYNAVFRLADALRLFPAAVLAVVFPALCRARDMGPLGRVAAGLAGAGGLAAAAAWALAPWMVGTFYGPAYVEAVPAFRVLLLSVPFFFLNYALTHQLIGWDGERAYAWLCGAALMANLAGNALLVPRLGINGAAWATLATELVVTTGCLVGLAAARTRRTGLETPVPVAS